MIKNYKIATLIISLTIFGCALSTTSVVNAAKSHHGAVAEYRHTTSRGAYVTSAPQHLHHTANHEDCPYAEDGDCPYTNRNQASQCPGRTNHHGNQTQTQSYGRNIRGHHGRGHHYTNREDCPCAIGE